MVHDAGLPSDWQVRLRRAYTTFDLTPFWEPDLHPRDEEGQWREVRGRIDLTPPTPEPPQIGDIATPEQVAGVEKIPMTGPLEPGTVLLTRRELRPDRTVGAEDPAAWAEYIDMLITDDYGGYRWRNDAGSKDAPPPTDLHKQAITGALDEMAEQFPLVKSTNIAPETDQNNLAQAQNSYWRLGRPASATILFNYAHDEKKLRDEGIVRDDADNKNKDTMTMAEAETVEESIRRTIIHETAHNLESTLNSLTSTGEYAHADREEFARIKKMLDDWLEEEIISMYSGSPTTVKRWEEPLKKSSGKDQSFYATENKREYIAEAFTDGYLNGAEASEGSQFIYNLFKDMLSGEIPVPTKRRPPR